MSEIKGFILILLCVMMVITSSVVIADSDEKQSDIKLSYDEKTDTLTISGHGCVSDEDFSDYYDIINKVKNVIIKDGITEIGSYAFESFGEIETVKLPSTLRKINAGAFFACQMLKEVELNKGLESIGYFAFSECENLKSVNIPKTVKKIGGWAFENTPWFESLDDEFCIVGDNVLIKYNGIVTKITDDNVKTSYIDELIIPDNVKCISSIIYDKYSDFVYINKVKLPKDLKYMYGTFYNCYIEQNELELPDGIIELGGCSICGGNFDRLYIPASLKSMGYGVFGYTERTYVFIGARPELSIDWSCQFDTDDGISVRANLDYNGFYEDSWKINDENEWEVGQMTFTLTSTFSYDPLLDEGIEPKCRGDVDGDGVVTPSDATFILRAVADLMHLNVRQLQSARLTGDVISTDDATKILRYVAKLDNEL